MEEKNISVGEAERWLDMDVYLTEHEWWETLQAPPQLPAAQDVHPYHNHRAERTWLCHLPRQAGAITCVRLGGGAICSRTHLHKLKERRDNHNLLGHVTVVAAAPGKHPVMWRWRSISARKTWILSMSASGIGRIPYHWRNQDAPPVPPGMTPRPNIVPGTMLTMITSKIHHEVPVRRP